MLFANRILRSGATLGGNRPGDKKFRRERVGKVIVAPSDACGEARRPWTADGAREGAEESPPSERKAAPCKRGSREGRQGRRNDTVRVARMIRPAMTLARDLVRRRLPAGASPSRRDIAPGRTLSPMPSEQKGAYGGHLASSVDRRLYGFRRGRRGWAAPTPLVRQITLSYGANRTERFKRWDLNWPPSGESAAGGQNHESCAPRPEGRECGVSGHRDDPDGRDHRGAGGRPVRDGQRSADRPGRRPPDDRGPTPGHVVELGAGDRDGALDPRLDDDDVPDAVAEQLLGREPAGPGDPADAEDR